MEVSNMEIRVLEYFLAVAREQSISGAAESLHLSQPTLSRQLKDLEDSLGKQLFTRGSRRITLTEEGMLLRKRAQEIVDLVKKTENEINCSQETISGDVYIGTGETDAVRLIARTARDLQTDYPGIRFRISSGDAADVVERLDKGLLDFGVLLDPVDIAKYNYLRFPVKDVWGVLMRKDSPLAVKDSIHPQDLWDKPLIFSRQNELTAWLKRPPSALNAAATYNLVYNASLMVDEGLGYALCLDKIINTTGCSNLCFRPLKPKLEIGINLVWKKYQIFSRASEVFLKAFEETLASLD